MRTVGAVGVSPHSRVRGLTRGEIEIAKRQGKAEPDRVVLERRVRVAACAAVDEADFVERLARDGLAIKARVDPVGDGVIGYMVALVDPTVDEASRWFAGGSLSKDLTLPKLRAAWHELAASS